MIKTERFELIPLTRSDVTERYVDWLNDPEINRYLEVRHEKQTLESCQLFIESVCDDLDDYLFGVFTEEYEHIGNIRLGPIDQRYRRAAVGLVIGERSWWGKGVATEIIRAITQFAFTDLKLNKLEAGAYYANLGSKRAFEHCGYQVEGILRDHFMDRGAFTDAWSLGLTFKDWQAHDSYN